MTTDERLDALEDALIRDDHGLSHDLDGLAPMSVREFVGWILVAVLVVFFVWIASSFYLIALAPA